MVGITCLAIVRSHREHTPFNQLTAQVELMLAERELGAPMGWEWKEAHFNPAPAGMGGGNNKPGPKFIEVEDPTTKKKKKVMVDSVLIEG